MVVWITVAVLAGWGMNAAFRSSCGDVFDDQENWLKHHRLPPLIRFAAVIPYFYPLMIVVMAFGFLAAALVVAVIEAAWRGGKSLIRKD